MPLEHHVTSSLEVKRADYRVATCNIDLVFEYADALDGLFGCDETLHNLVLLQVDATDHLIPRGSEEHVVLF